jgi:hypothetical protein
MLLQLAICAVMLAAAMLQLKSNHRTYEPETIPANYTTMTRQLGFSLRPGATFFLTRLGQTIALRRCVTDD